MFHQLEHGREVKECINKKIFRLRNFGYQQRIKKVKETKAML